MKTPARLLRHPRLSTVLPLALRPRLQCLFLPFLLLPAISATAQIDFAPTNDLFDKRSDLGSTETAGVSQAVLRASTEFGDPIHNSVWWQWTAPRDGWWEVVASTSSVNAAYDPEFQVFEGDKLELLRTAPSAGLSEPTPSKRRLLFRAAAGRKYQIAASCVQPPYKHIGFDLRPVTPAANTSPETRVALVPQEGGPSKTEWIGQGWSLQTGAVPVVTAGGTVLSAPLFWEWTCPADGTYGAYRGSEASTMGQQVAAYRGQFPSATNEVGLDGYLPNARAGETYLFVSGNGADYSKNAQHHDLRVAQAVSLNEEPSNHNNPWPLQSSLPLTATLPTNAPRNSTLWWTWNCQEYGWVEFDGPGLRPGLQYNYSEHYFDPIILPQAGKHYLWVNPGPYLMPVSGWTWPATGSSGFKLRRQNPVAPPNDFFAQATDMGSESVASIQGSLAGATRQAGDPPPPQGISPQPTVWHRWQPSGGTGVAELFLSYPLYGSSESARLQVLTGTDPAFLSEVPVTYLPADDFAPQRFQFPVKQAFTTYHLCLEGNGGDYTLQGNLITGGTGGTAHPSNLVTTLEGGPVSEGAGTTDPFSQVMFRWTAPADGQITWFTTAASVQLLRGPTLNHLTETVAYKVEMPQPRFVYAGETYWFRCSPEDQTGARPNLHRLRVLFSKTGYPGPGDIPETAIPLGTQLPVRINAPLSSSTASDAERFWSRDAVKNTFSRGLWLTWTAPADVSGCEAQIGNASFEIYADRPGGTRVAFMDPFTDQAAAVFRPQPGRTYSILIQAAENAVSDFMPLSLRRVNLKPAVNDNFADAATIPASVLDLSHGFRVLVPYGDFESTRYTLSAESGEPLADAAQPAATRSAWWRWTAAADVVCRLNTPVPTDWVVNSYSRSFTVAVYQGASSPAGLVRVPAVPAHYRPDGQFYWNIPPNRSLTFQAKAGQEYFFQVSTPDEFGGLSLNLTPGDAYDKWSLQQPKLDPVLAGPETNPSGDGMSNLLKFCLGLNPALSLSADPNSSRAPALSVLPDGSAMHYTFWSDRFNTGNTIPFPANGSQVFADTARLIAERSSDLENWTRVTDAEFLGANRWRVSLPINGTQSKRFVRLRAEWITPSQPQ